jgi:transposase-like protein
MFSSSLLVIIFWLFYLYTNWGADHDDALTKMIYLAYRDISKKWTMAIRDWAFIFSQFSIIFEERLKPFLK